MPYNKEKQREYQRQWRLKNKEELAAYQREWCKRNEARVNEQRRQRRINNRDKVNATSRAWTLRNQERVRTKRRAWEGARKAENRGILRKLKSQASCAHCGHNDPDVLDAHHVQREWKQFDISRAIACHVTWRRIASELTKCIWLCRNCHAKVTKAENHWLPASMGISLDGPPPCEIIDMFKQEQSS